MLIESVFLWIICVKSMDRNKNLYTNKYDVDNVNKRIQQSFSLKIKEN